MTARASAASDGRAVGPPAAPVGTGRIHAPLDYLEGRWELSRVIADERRATRGRFRGSASFERTELGLLAYTESGELELPGHRGRATRSYRYLPDGAHRFRVEFADGRAFHDGELSPAGFETEHRCGSDRYAGRYVLGSKRRWSLSWRITGPAKSLHIESVFERVR